MLKLLFLTVAACLLLQSSSAKPAEPDSSYIADDIDIDLIKEIVKDCVEQVLEQDHEPPAEDDEQVVRLLRMLGRGNEQKAKKPGGDRKKPKLGFVHAILRCLKDAGLGPKQDEKESSLRRQKPGAGAKTGQAQWQSSPPKPDAENLPEDIDIEAIKAAVKACVEQALSSEKGDAGKSEVDEVSQVLRMMLGTRRGKSEKSGHRKPKFRYIRAILQCLKDAGLGPQGTDQGQIAKRGKDKGQGAQGHGGSGHASGKWDGGQEGKIGGENGKPEFNWPDIEKEPNFNWPDLEKKLESDNGELGGKGGFHGGNGFGQGTGGQNGEKPEDLDVEALKLIIEACIPSDEVKRGGFARDFFECVKQALAADAARIE